MNGYETDIINEIMKKCTTKTISDALMYRLNEKWGCPDLSIDYKTEEHKNNKAPLKQIEDFFEDHQLHFSPDDHSLRWIQDIQTIYSIRYMWEIIEIRFKNNNTIITLELNKSGQLGGIST